MRKKHFYCGVYNKGMDLVYLKRTSKSEVSIARISGKIQLQEDVPEAAIGLHLQ